MSRTLTGWNFFEWTAWLRASSSRSRFLGCQHPERGPAPGGAGPGSLTGLQGTAAARWNFALAFSMKSTSPTSMYWPPSGLVAMDGEHVTTRLGSAGGIRPERYHRVGGDIAVEPGDQLAIDVDLGVLIVVDQELRNMHRTRIELE